MSTSTTARKTPAKRSPAKAPAKAAPAKKAVANKAAAPKAAPEKRTYSATSRSGRVAIRQFTTVMAFAIDVADASARSAQGQRGLIWGFAPTREKAEAAAARAVEKGLDAIVVKAEAVI